MFGENLKKLRLNRGLSQEKIANELHVVRQTISKWETGASSPYVEQLESILSLFDIEPICSLKRMRAWQMKTMLLLG